MKTLATGARRAHVLFNNCHGDKAQRNAAQFRDLLFVAQAPANRRRA